MKAYHWQIFLLLSILVFFKLADLSSSEDEKCDDFSVDLKGPSSDDEDSVKTDDSNFGADLLREFGRMDLYAEVSSEFEKQSDSKFRVTDGDGAKPLSCLDGSGREVDWWFVYKEPNGKRYLYLSSLDVEKSDAANSTAAFIPLNDKFLIDDPNTSPVLKTIYHPDNAASSSEVWLGWNDQIEDNIDAYDGRVCGVKHPHSKGFYAQNAIFTDNNKDGAVIGSYAILTSLPRFPQIAEGAYTSGGAVRNQLPLDPSGIFGTNLSLNAQHFMCLSFQREKARLNTVVGGGKEVQIFPDSVHRNFLSKYLKTIHPAIIGTNYADRNLGHRIWRQYFSLLEYPYKEAWKYLNTSYLNLKLKAYCTSELPSMYEANVLTPSKRVFPLTATQFYRKKSGEIEYDPDDFFSRWDARFGHQNGCLDGSQDSCIQSFTFKTTSLHSPLEGIFFAKHFMVVLDVFDDWAALQVAESQKHFENYYAGQNVDRYGLLVQSWIDTKTVLPRKPDKKIYDEKGRLIAKVHIDNLAHFNMPSPPNSIRVYTSHKDHSKWALGFALDTFNSDANLEDGKASFNPLVFVSDLNRATTQACLKGKTHGRGGGIVAISSINLWHALMNLGPRSFRQKFVTKGKHRTRLLQNRLRRHTSNDFCGLNSLSVNPLRKFTFKSLRLSQQEAKKPAKPVQFIPVLNEISKFIKLAKFKSEHATLAAFQRLFRNFSEGKVLHAAKAAWDRTLQHMKTQTDSGLLCIAHWPKLFSLPSLQLYREIPESYENNLVDRRFALDSLTNYLRVDSLTGVIDTFYEHDVRSIQMQNYAQEEGSDIGIEEEEDSDTGSEEEDSDTGSEEEDSDNGSEEEGSYDGSEEGSYDGSEGEGSYDGSGDEYCENDDDSNNSCIDYGECSESDSNSGSSEGDSKSGCSESETEYDRITRRQHNEDDGDDYYSDDYD